MSTVLDAARVDAARGGLRLGPVATAVSAALLGFSPSATAQQSLVSATSTVFATGDFELPEGISAAPSSFGGGYLVSDGDFSGLATASSNYGSIHSGEVVIANQASGYGEGYGEIDVLDDRGIPDTAARRLGRAVRRPPPARRRATDHLTVQRSRSAAASFASKFAWKFALN